MTLGTDRSDLPIGSTSLPVYLRFLIDQISNETGHLGRRVDFALPGLELSVHAFEGTLIDAFEDNLVNWPTAYPMPSARKLSVYLAHARLPDMPRAVPFALSPGETSPFEGALTRFGLHGLHDPESGAWYAYDPKRSIGIQLLRGPDVYPPWEVGSPFRLFLHWHYSEQNQRVTHAGTLGKNGRGALLLGAGGSGKSGTVISGILHGLESVGDDYVLLDPRSPTTAYPLFLAMRQDLAGFERLDLDRFIPRDRPLNWQGKIQFSLDELGGRSLVKAMEIESLLVPHRGDSSRTSIRPTSASEGLRALALSSLAQLSGEKETGFRFFAEIARKLPSYSLSLGSDATEIADRVTRFLEDGRTD